MSTFVLAFILLILVMIGMALGVILSGRTIKGSCGGLNAISGADKCLVCKREIDPDSPLRDQLACPRKQKVFLARAVTDACCVTARSVSACPLPLAPHEPTTVQRNMRVVIVGKTKRRGHLMTIVINEPGPVSIEPVATARLG